MRTKSMLAVIGVTAGLFVTSARAQHEEHHQDLAAPSDANTPGGMMPGNIMSQMPQMMMGQNEAASLVDRLMKSYAAVEAEKNPTARRKKLAEHGLLLKELQTNVQAQLHLMEMTQQLMAGSMMGGKITGGMATGEHKQ
jgi:hypothetical protein